jgi:hypothetical protein
MRLTEAQIKEFIEKVWSDSPPVWTPWEEVKVAEACELALNHLIDNAYLSSAPLIAVTELPTTPTKEST